MIFRSDWRQALMLFLTSDSSRTSSSSIVTRMVLRSSGISPREQNEKHQQDYWANYPNIFSKHFHLNIQGPPSSFHSTHISVPCRAWMQGLVSSSVLSLPLSS